MIRIGVTGASGRMGQAVAEALGQQPDGAALALAAAHVRTGSTAAGSRLGEVIITDDLAAMLAEVDVVIDFTLPAFTVELADACSAADKPLVSGTTGLGEVEWHALRNLATTVPVFHAPNMSLGVNLLLQVVQSVASRLGEDYDAEIVEAHHRHKQDAPSGTALALGQRIALARDKEFDAIVDHGRKGRTGERQRGRIGMHSLRGGEIVGEHDVRFVASGEEIRIGHSALSRNAFAAGALRAATWLHGREPGLYGFEDMLREAE